MERKVLRPMMTAFLSLGLLVWLVSCLKYAMSPVLIYRYVKCSETVFVVANTSRVGGRSVAAVLGGGTETDMPGVHRAKNCVQNMHHQACSACHATRKSCRYMCRQQTRIGSHCSHRNICSSSGSWTAAAVGATQELASCAKTVHAWHTKTLISAVIR
jgi:hypothetical protein